MFLRPRSLFVLLSLALLIGAVPSSVAAEDGLADVRMPRLREALRESEPLAQAWFRMRAGDVSGARRALQTLVRADPRNPDALHLYGMAAAASGKRITAVRVLKKSVRIRPDGWVGLHLVNLHLDAGRVRPASKLVARLEDSLPADLQVRQARAFVLVVQGDFVAARTRFQSLEADEVSAAAAAQLAALHGELGEEGEAADALERAVERAPEDSSYRRRHFEALVRAADWSSLAKAAGAKGAEIAGAGLHFYYSGLAALRLEKRDLGIERLAGLVAWSDADPVALAAATALLFQTDAWPQSEAAARALLAQRSEEPGVHHLLAMSLSRQHRESEALAHYRRAAELGGKDAELHFDLLVSLCSLERQDELAGRMPRALREFDEDLRFGQLATQCLPQDDD